MPWKPTVPGERPTLGFLALDWIEENLAAPDKPDYEPFIPTREQAEFILALYELDPNTCTRRIRRAVLSRARGWGKALALDTPLPTPDGWTTMGAVAVGDRLFDETGGQCRVVAKTEVWTDTDCYRVTFSDGQAMVASGDHLWTVDKVYGQARVTVDTRTLAQRHRDREGRCLYRVNSPGPLTTPEVALPIDPYTLGAWLGDGNSDDGRITSADPEVLDHVAEAGWRVERRASATYRWQVFGLKQRLAALGVLGNKHIPGAYLRGSTAQRLALVQGLMDTDGSVYDAGVCEFTTTNPALRLGFSELLSSLGIKHGVYEGRALLRGRDCGTKWRIKFTVHADTPVVRLPRKAARLRPASTTRVLHRTRTIRSVERVATVPTVCITVDSPSSLFLAGERMVPTHNSPFISAVAILEALGPVVPVGWDDDGQPMAQPWSYFRTPLVQLAAASEAQTKNAWTSLREMLREDAPLHDNYPGIEVLGGFVNLPWAGRIEPITTSATSAKGNRPICVLCDQTEQWTMGNGSVDVFDVLRNNVAKTGGIIVETPNAYIPGMGSQAERTAKTFLDISEGRNKRLTEGVLYDHREADGAVDIADPTSLTEGLRYAYGCSSDDPRGCVIHEPPCEPGWAPIQGFVQRFYETDAEEQQSRSDFLNQITHASDAWLSGPDWAAISDATKVVADRELITLGFDGSRGRVKGKPDATALIGCRVADGHLFEIKVWEAENLPATWEEWQPPIVEIEAAIASAFGRWSVAAFYCDPGRDWRSHVNSWEAEYGNRVQIKARRDHPFEWWMTGGRATAVQQAVEDLEGAIRNRDITHSGEFALTSHVLAARRRFSHGKLALAKSSDYSIHKVDAAIAAVLAYQGRLAAVTAGLTAPLTQSAAPRRIR